MKGLLNFFKRTRKIQTTKIDNLFVDPFFKDINYPIIINISIFVIYRDTLDKFYAAKFSIVDLERDIYENSILKDIAEHIKNRIYSENYSYIYHLQNLNTHKTIRYLNPFGDGNMFQKVCTRIIHKEKDLKEYLDLILFGPSEPFIENIDDLDKV